MLHKLNLSGVWCLGFRAITSHFKIRLPEFVVCEGWRLGFRVWDLRFAFEASASPRENGKCSGPRTLH